MSSANSIMARKFTVPAGLTGRLSKAEMSRFSRVEVAAVEPQQERSWLFRKLERPFKAFRDLLLEIPLDAWYSAALKHGRDEDEEQVEPAGKRLKVRKDIPEEWKVSIPVHP